MIRPYLPSDKPHLIELIRLNTPPYFDKSEEALFSNYLDNEREDYFVLESSGKIIGCGGLNYEKGKTEAVLSWGMIHPSYHGLGYGTQITQHRINHLKTIRTAHTLVVRTSQHTSVFYEKMGFKVLEIKENYWAPGLHLHYMKMKL
ncbi:GNAT family N-acetyltransferase [Owenweeksia hongkongensis]|uniref:Acetyltransferase, N-acetylglutamate synthase n=1 Tax=Owenweeksia hongkongensis (strain DSM 17368 / CIP 108786 / JCM 12287 / NRRL B-23963 / UST20020801) TaxID=926562 RepID=G8R711_OWEHD|nr:GNAT family N-acetyltransferase [Owenweeksia hongkongensis]AEV33376.1 acetyltransferase, N-acetylglutamate synthase [Owenweeksia hongkongensis DSM 17368]